MRKLNSSWVTLLSGPFFYPVALLLALIVFFPALSPRVLNDIDYDLVIIPLRQVHSLSDYAEAFIGRKLLDVQPIRDLSLRMDIALEALFGHQVFGLFNLFYWIGACLFLERLLVRLSPGVISRSIVLLVLTHPLLGWVISWPTARKHILAAFFIMLASWLAVLYKEGKEKLGIWIILTYALSVWSQPITLLWIGVFLLYLGKDARSKRHWPLLGILGMIFVLTTAVNFVYYDQVYPHLVGTGKTGSDGPHTIGIKILSFSRSLTQLLLPLNFAVEYSFHSLLNLLGLPLALLAGWLLSLRLPRKQVLLSGLFALHPLFLINFRSTNIFVSDTYLLVPLLGLGLLLALFLRTVKEKGLTAVFALGLTLIFGAKAWRETELATGGESYFKTSYEREPICRNAIAYANHLLRSADLRSFYEVSESAFSNHCFLGGHVTVVLTGQIYAVRIFMDESLSDEKKLVLLEKARLIPSVTYLMAITNARLGKTDEAMELFRSLNLERLQPKEALRKLHERFCPATEICAELRL